MIAHTRRALTYFLSLLIIPYCTRSARGAEAPQDAGASQALTTAEQAFQRVDFAATYESACGALERGHADVQQTVRLQVLCGISAAALEKPDEARIHFTVALAMRPELRLERDLSPKIRSPYLEAQGTWAGAPERLSVKPVNRADRSRLHFKIVDPMHLGAKLKAYLRVLDEPRYRAVTVEPHASTSVALPSDFGQRDYDYYAILEDSRGNALVELGSETDPFSVRAAPRQHYHDRAEHPVTTRSLGSPGEEGHSRWFPISLLATGMVAAGAGAYFNVKREDAADTWNGPGCERPGLTRMAQCASIDSDRVRAERAAIGLYAAGGVLVASGIAIWALSGPTRAESSRAASQPARVLACGATPALIGVACSGQF